MHYGVARVAAHRTNPHAEVSSPHKNTFMDTKKKELISIQLLRALASLLVLLAHLQIKERQYGDGAHLIWQHFGIGAIGVDIFFVLSGFIIFFVAGSSPSSARSAFRFLKHRIVRVIPLYWALSVIALAVFLLHPQLVNKSSNKPTEILSSFLLWPTANKLLIQNGWTLSYEFLFYSVFFLAILLLAPAKRIFFMLGAALTGFVIGAADRPESIVGSFLTNSLILEFAFGLVIGALYHSQKKILAFTPPRGVVSLIVGAATITSLGVFSVPAGSIRGIVYGLPAAALVFGALSLEDKLAAFRRLKILGDSSYSLYLVHVLVLSAAGIAWDKLSLSAHLGNIGLLLFLFSSSVISGILLFRYFELPLTTYLRRRFG